MCRGTDLQARFGVPARVLAGSGRGRECGPHTLGFPTVCEREMVVEVQPS